VGYLLFPFRLVLTVLWIFAGLFTVMVLFPGLPPVARQWAIRNWSRALMACCGVKIRSHGRPRRQGAVLWVANHVSWVDIFVMDSVRAVSFIAKSDIRKWPLIGWLVAGAGTLFIERGRRHAVRAVGHQMLERFERGEAVGLFPEGTTSTGLDVAPFHSSLFGPALRAGVDVQPVALLFWQNGRRSTRIAFVGDQTLVHNVWELLTSTDTVVDVVFCPVIAAAECEQLGRAGVAQQAERMIREIVTSGKPVHSAA
jgi:1-acyl-sn-glycerol-3-phosphate acyltransferase